MGLFDVNFTAKKKENDTETISIINSFTNYAMNGSIFIPLFDIFSNNNIFFTLKVLLSTLQ